VRRGLLQRCGHGAGEAELGKLGAAAVALLQAVVSIREAAERRHCGRVHRFRRSQVWLGGQRDGGPVLPRAKLSLGWNE
jgi:hypothetical protein